MAALSKQAERTIVLKWRTFSKNLGIRTIRNPEAITIASRTCQESGKKMSNAARPNPEDVRCDNVDGTPGPPITLKAGRRHVRRANGAAVMKA